MKPDTTAIAKGRSQLAAAYGLTILGTIALCYVIIAMGESLAGSAASGPATLPGPVAPAAREDVLRHVLLALLAIICCCDWFGSISTRSFPRGQPPRCSSHSCCRPG